MDFEPEAMRNILRRPYNGRKEYFSMAQAESRDFG